jgi:hypothetical protein
MAIGIVSDDEFERELERLKAPKKEPEPKRNENNEKEESPTPGRGENNVAVPQELRALIGQTAIESGRTEALLLAKQFNISPSSVSAYTHGATSTASYDNPEPKLKKKIDVTKDRIGKIARGRLLASLKHITDEKLADAKLRDVASVAANMSAIVKNMEPADKNAGINNINIVLYAPKIRNESSYEVIEGETE